jgi:hypothetical protein
MWKLKCEGEIVGVLNGMISIASLVKTCRLIWNFLWELYYLHHGNHTSDGVGDPYEMKETKWE